MLSLQWGVKAAFTLLSRAWAEATVMGKTESSGKGRPEKGISGPMITVLTISRQLWVFWHINKTGGLLGSDGLHFRILHVLI